LMHHKELSLSESICMMNSGSYITAHLSLLSNFFHDDNLRDW